MDNYAISCDWFSNIVYTVNSKWLHCQFNERDGLLKLVIDILYFISLIYVLFFAAAVAFLIELVSVCSQTVMDVLGPDIHAKGIGKIHLIQFDPEGVFGWIPTQKELVNNFLSGD